MDMLNLTANERLDLADLSYATFDSQIGLHRAITGQVMMDANAAAPAYILSGFAVSNPSGQQITVTKGVALLPYRTDTQVLYGMVSTDGPTVQTLDLSTRASGTYTVYITFSYQPGSTDTRTLWSSDNGGAEYASAVPTRQVAGWQLVIESASPGAEWVPIAQVTTPSMAIVDMRPFYFEGRPDQSFVPQWGATADRATTRATNPVTNLQTFVQAMQQCLIDIKGPGIANWYTPFIAGQTIGYKGTAKAASTAWYDGNFYAQGDASNPRHVYSGDGATLAYARGLNAFTVTGGTAATATTLNFTAPGASNGTKGPYSLVASATSFALTDTVNSVSPVVYTAATETTDLTAGGLGTVILPTPDKVKYTAPQLVTTYLNIMSGIAAQGVIFYGTPYSGAPGATYTYNATTGASYTALTGIISLGLASGTTTGVGMAYVLPVRLPGVCTITNMSINYRMGLYSTGNILLMKKLNPSTVTQTGTPAVVVAKSAMRATSSSAFGAEGFATAVLSANFSESVAATDLSAYFILINCYNASSDGSASAAPTLQNSTCTIDYISLTHTVAGPSYGSHG